MSCYSNSNEEMRSIENLGYNSSKLNKGLSNTKFFLFKYYFVIMVNKKSDSEIKPSEVVIEDGFMERLESQGKEWADIDSKYVEDLMPILEQINNLNQTYKKKWMVFFMAETFDDNGWLSWAMLNGPGILVDELARIVNKFAKEKFQEMMMDEMEKKSNK